MNYKIIALLAVLLLSACSDPKPICVAADDWGYPKVWVPSNPGKDRIIGDYGGQSVPWIDSDRLILDANTAPLIITLQNAGDFKEVSWSSWFFGDTNQVPRGKICNYREPLAPQSFGTSVLKADGFNDLCEDTDKPDMYADCWAPCWLTDGYGLYMLAGNKNDSGSFTKHIADIDGDGYLVKDLPGNLDIKTNDRLYFKILDRYYEDNGGGYLVRLKKGTKSPDPGVIEYVVSLFTGPVDTLMETLYRGIVENNTFINIVRLCLTLYIILYGLSFMIQMRGSTTFVDLLIRTLKFGVVIQLLSEDSWDFFYNYLFRLFIDGANDIAALVASPFEEYNPSSPWWSIDQLLEKFMSSETWAKISSLLFNDALGFLYIGLFAVAVFILMLAILWAMKVYLLAYVIMAFLVVLAPIFIIFLLFGLTKERFNDWIAQFGAVFLQIVLLFTALGMFVALINFYLERTLGFQACWDEIFAWNIPLPTGDTIEVFSFSFWEPSVDPRNVGNILVKAPTGEYYIDERLIDLPYLDPDIEDDMKRIKAIAYHGDYVNVGDMFVFLAALYLMWNFLTIVDKIADILKANAIGAGSRYESAGIVPGSGPSGVWSGLKGRATDAAKGVKKFFGTYHHSTPRPYAPPPPAPPAPGAEPLPDINQVAHLNQDLRRRGALDNVLPHLIDRVAAAGELAEYQRLLRELDTATFGANANAARRAEVENLLNDLITRVNNRP